MNICRYFSIIRYSNHVQCVDAMHKKFTSTFFHGEIMLSRVVSSNDNIDLPNGMKYLNKYRYSKQCYNLFKYFWKGIAEKANLTCPCTLSQ